jgi:hypothetical protein
VSLLKQSLAPETSARANDCAKRTTSNSPIFVLLEYPTFGREITVAGDKTSDTQHWGVGR